LSCPSKGWYSEMLDYRISGMTKEQRQRILSRSGVDLEAVTEQAREVVDDVRREGDIALLKYARRFDGFGRGSLTVSAGRIRSARDKIPAELLKALRISKARITKFHSRQRMRPFEFKDSCGTMGQVVVPLERIGVYVPGGTASYMSSLLMACIPAGIAGVREICVCTPGKDGRVADEILAAADLCGVTEVHPVGGAHAVAAMAYGTESIRKVQKIVGPGGVFVTAAKLLIRNDCEIDFLAGPSEVLIIADGSANHGYLAMDMLAQLEHDPLARAVLVTTSQKVASGVRSELENAIANAERAEIARKSAEKGAVILVAKDISEAVDFSNEYAPEHLLIDTRSPTRILPLIRNAGSVFLGRHSSVAFGDYCSGTNHILPTKGTASMKSALGVYDFVKVMPYQNISSRGAEELSRTVEVLARAEGLPAHAKAAASRARRVRQ